jgi:hypothetical protein
LFGWQLGSWPSIFDAPIHLFFMARIDRLNYKAAAKAKAFDRLKQLLVLFLAVVFGVLLSVSVNAQSDYKKQNNRFFKARYKHHVNISDNACLILKKKGSNAL